MKKYLSLCTLFVFPFIYSHFLLWYLFLLSYCCYSLELINWKISWKKMSKFSKNWQWNADSIKILSKFQKKIDTKKSSKIKYCRNSSGFSTTTDIRQYYRSAYGIWTIVHLHIEFGQLSICIWNLDIVQMRLPKF